MKRPIAREVLSEILAAVFHHEEPGHKALPAEDAERLLRLSEALRAMLARRQR